MAIAEIQSRAAEADGWNIQITLSKFALLHCFSFCHFLTAGHSDFNEAMSIEKRYFTSLLSIRA